MERIQLHFWEVDALQVFHSSTHLISYNTVFLLTFQVLSINLIMLSVMFMVGILVRNTLVTYDREHSKIGFWKTNCSELWERLHVSPSPLPMPPTSEEKNPTAETQPTVAPSGSPYVLSGSAGYNTSSNIKLVCYFRSQPMLSVSSSFIGWCE